MKIRLLISTLLISVSANALIIPTPSPYDKRIQSVVYNPDDVVEVNTIVGRGTQIVFAPGEQVISDQSSAGFLDGWSLTPNSNSVIIKAISIQGKDAEGKDTIIEPVPGQWNTNILVTTNRGVYAFDLKLISGGNKVAYVIKFKYPQDDAARIAAEKAEIERKASLDKTPVVKNSAYKMQIRKKSESIAPSNVFDDGEFTYFTFPGNRDIPAIFLVSDNKKESIVNSHIDPKMPGTVVVHKIGRQFYLRYGDSVVGVYNEAFDDVGVLNTTGTTIEGVQREVKRQ
jgi:type IV secretion system protein VirB9